MKFFKLFVEIQKILCYYLNKLKKNVKKGVDSMLNDEICKLRDELNKSIETDQDYETIYELSVKLDKLIEKYYGINNNKKVSKLTKDKLIIM